MNASDSPLPVLTRQQIELQYPFLTQVAPTYDGPARLLDWKHTARDGMTVDIVMTLPNPLGGHPFRGMAAGKENGQRFFIIASLARQVDGGPPVLVHQGEALLLRWSENDRTGMMGRLLLDDGPDGVVGRNPFFGLTIGRMSGEALEFVAWGIGEDEQGLPPSRLRTRTPFHQLTEVQQSNILCRDPKFRHFLMHNLEVLVPDAAMRESVLALQSKPEQFASAAVRASLGVASRSVMNQDGPAAQQAVGRWRTMLARYETFAWGRR